MPKSERKLKRRRNDVLWRFPDLETVARIYFICFPCWSIADRPSKTICWKITVNVRMYACKNAQSFGHATVLVLRYPKFVQGMSIFNEVKCYQFQDSHFGIRKSGHGQILKLFRTGFAQSWDAGPDKASHSKIGICFKWFPIKTRIPHQRFLISQRKKIDSTENIKPSQMASAHVINLKTVLKT